MTIKLSRPSLIALAVSMSALSGGFTFAAEGMDISTMGRGSMPLDHSKMGHGAMQEQMEGMDHSNMDHSQMNHGSPRTTSRTPIPVLTDADRQAAFAPLPGHTVHDSGINSSSCSISLNIRTLMRAAPWPGMPQAGWEAISIGSGFVPRESVPTA